jgi:transposase
VHPQGLFTCLPHRWQALGAPRFDVRLYDLTRTDVEADPPQEGNRRFGYSREKRSDGVQVVIALSVTPEGFPLADAVRAGNISDTTPLAELWRKIETQEGNSERSGLMDRGLPTEETRATRRQAPPPIDEVVGTPKGR